jgi:hypothetical protein
MSNCLVTLGGSAAATNILDTSIANTTLGNASLMVNGSTWQLNGSYTYAGFTVVSNGGTLLLEGTLGNNPSGGVIVTKNGILGGNGTINDNVTVVTNGILSPGDSIGLLTINGNLTNNGSISVQLNKAAGTNDHIVGLNNLQYGGRLVVTNLAGSLTATDSFQLFSATTYSGAFSSVSPATPGPGLAWDLSGLTNGVLRIAAGASSPPTITTIVVSGGNVILRGTNGTAGGDFYVLSSTNVALPVANWTRLATNAFDGSGNFSVTNAVNPNLADQFFRIVVP